MSEVRGENRLVAYEIAIVAFTSLVLSVGFAARSTLVAVEERQSAAAAMDMFMAATAVAHADQLDTLGGEFPPEDLARSVAALKNDRASALRSLTREEAREANQLLDEIGSDANVLLDPTQTGQIADGHDRLRELLRSASQRSLNAATGAERMAAIALAAMAVAAAVVAALVMGSRARTVRAKALAGAQLRAGQRLQVLLNDSPDILLVVGADEEISYQSASSSSLLKSSSDSVDDLVSLAHPQDRQSFRAHLQTCAVHGASALFRLGKANRETGWFEVRVSDLTDHELVEGHLLTIRDVTNEVRLRSELQHQANSDVLTGLPNRRVLQTSLDAAQAALETTGSTMALIILDIDGFKAINDTFGHLAGDELLVQVAARLSQAIRDEETLIRLGGDEFAIIASNLPGGAAAELTGNRLLKVLDEPFGIGDRTEHVRTSIGVATTDNPDKAPLLLGEADVALYEAKRLGGDKVVVFERALESTTSRRDQITRALRDADYDREFRIVYQPIVTTETREISTLEALLRWTSPTLGDVAPNEFIPIAELTGEICLLGKWVFDQVCHQLSEWAEAGMDDAISVSVNVSPRQLGEQPFVSYVLDTTRSWGIEPAKLIIEITESAALDHAGKAQHRIEQLRAAGFRISIDDFGSGYSNLGQLLAVPFDIIKVDRSLLLTLSDMREHAGGDATDACGIMEAIVSIACILETPVVCEGVETEDRFTSLRASGISHIQGYLTGRPSPPHVITPLICVDSPSRIDPLAKSVSSPTTSPDV